MIYSALVYTHCTKRNGDEDVLQCPSIVETGKDNLSSMNINHRIWNNDISLKKNFLFFSECCHSITVTGKGDVKNALPIIFTTYTVEHTLFNGHVHYTSQDGRKAIAFANKRKHWKIQPVSDR